MVSYLYWQYVSGPRWLLVLLGTMQRAVWQYFSVGFMVRTLFAYWRRDSVRTQAGLGGILMAWAWNVISRAIGFVIRVSVVAAWIVCNALVLTASLLVFCAFLLWPLLVLGGFIAGVVLILQGL